MAAERVAYTVPEAAEALSVGRDLVYRLINNGTLRSVKLGSRRVIPVSAVQELMETAAG